MEDRFADWTRERMQRFQQMPELRRLRSCAGCDSDDDATLPSELGDVTCASASAAEESLESVAFGADRRAPEVGRRYEKATLRRKM